MTRLLERGGVVLRLERGDITERRADAIVNAANPSLLGGGGVDGAIHRRGGPTILEECRRIRASQYPEGMPTGDAVATGAGALPALHVIHAVGPIWRGGGQGEAAQLARAYESALQCARDAGARSVAFPSISTGAYGYPVEAAAEIAIGTVLARVQADPGALQEVVFVLFSERDLQAYEAALERFAAASPR